MVAEKRFFSLMGDEVRGQMQQLRVLQKDRVGAPELDEEAFLAQCIYVETLLKEVADLSMLMQCTLSFYDERIEMNLLMQDQLLIGVSSRQPVNGSCAKCQIAQQDHIYASDMAILLADK